MRTIVVAATLCALPLAACNKSPSDKLADRIENAADMRADGMESEAAALQRKASEVRKNGEQRADAIDAANRNVAAMSQEQRDAIVANEAAAVR